MERYGWTGASQWIILATTTQLLVALRFTTTPVTTTQPMDMLLSTPTPPAPLTPVLAPGSSNQIPPAPTIPLLAMVRSTPTLPVPITPLLDSLHSAPTPPPPVRQPLVIKPPMAPPHTTTKAAHISGIRQDTPQARALTTTPFSGIRQDTALPPERITS